jgi:staphylococcal nuclease domain-containing protein 1
MQRDVEIEIDTTDKSGGFIGSLYLNKTENAAVELVKAGLATVHTYSAEGLSWAHQLFEAEVSVFSVCRNLEPHSGFRQKQKLREEMYVIQVRSVSHNHADLLKIWCDHDPEAEASIEASQSHDGDGQALRTEYLDIIVSAVRTTPSFGFSVQILNTEGKLMPWIIMSWCLTTNKQGLLLWRNL